MTTHFIFLVIIWIFLFETFLTKFLSYLNTTRWSDEIPAELEGIYDEKKYATSQKYERTKYNFSWVSSGITFFLMLFILLSGGFGILDNWLRGFSQNEIFLALSFF